MIDNLERALQRRDRPGEAPPSRTRCRGRRARPTASSGGARRAGVEAFDPTGEKFDPQLHEALSTAAGRGRRAGTVVEVVQKGYRLGDQLLRPARVVVSK